MRRSIFKNKRPHIFLTRTQYIFSCSRVVLSWIVVSQLQRRIFCIFFTLFCKGYNLRQSLNIKKNRWLLLLLIPSLFVFQLSTVSESVCVPLHNNKRFLPLVYFYNNNELQQLLLKTKSFHFFLDSQSVVLLPKTTKFCMHVYFVICLPSLTTVQIHTNVYALFYGIRSSDQSKN